MSTSRHSLRKSSRACTECQRRKTRCIGSNGPRQPCIYCSKTGKQCIFEAPPSRTSLTRANLEISERRCQQLESLLRDFDPELDIEAAIAQISNDTTTLPESGITNLDQDDNRSSASSDEYEWHESKESAEARDGMANIPKSRKSGYLGSSSGSSLFQAMYTSLRPDLSSQAQLGQPDPSHSQDDSTFRGIQLDMSESLSNSMILDALINVYFESYNACYPILHRDSFLRRYRNRRQISYKNSWQIIFYMVLALGHWISTTEVEHRRSPYFHAARSRFSVEVLESGTLELVQACLLMGNYLQKTDRPNTGWNFTGIAYRMAVGLGLHRELTSSIPTDAFARERRRQVFWTLYCFESGFSITTGRPTTTSDDFIDARLPRNVEASGQISATSIPKEVDYPTPNSAILAHSQLSIIANQLYAGLLSAKNVGIPDKHDFIASMDSRLTHWTLSLPVIFRTADVPLWFRMARSVVLWKELNLHTLLWRTSQRHTDLWPGEEESRRRCQSTALETIHTVAAFCEEYAKDLHQGIRWYATYFVFQAAIILVGFKYERLTVPSSNDGFIKEGEENLREAGISRAKGCLGELRSHSHAAARCLSVLSRLHRSSAETSEGGNSATAEPGELTAPPQLEDLPAQALLSTQNSVDELPQVQPSPDTDDLFRDGWSSMADPSLSLLLDNTTIQGLFDDSSGFPWNAEQAYFDYVNWNMDDMGNFH
ncbi:hypothetical protein NA57DRAFT_57231 [Rhizodiscina lignyota]|uniref:Zn(2)-C6 fungal-type domain-containing protein n=1 Tax=Rhizodiscina lignyota TaxID=1504668 RepID=A0A9P4M4T6_9PEZI|nr:hypothetical protein NA57DRAFT_57231 [Rhizodiscina lignyota]